MPTEEEVTQSVMAVMPTSKAQIASFSRGVLQQIDEGTLDPLNIHVKLKSIEKVFKSLNENEDYKKAVVSQAEKHGSKEFKAFGAKIELVEVAVKYDYSKCGHVFYDQVCAEMERLKKIKDDYEILLKALKKSELMTFEDEEVEVFPPVKNSTSSVKVTF